MTGDTHKHTARALENRRLAKVSRRGGAWGATLTDDGRYYLEHARYVDPPPEAASAEMPGPRATRTERLLQRQAKRIASGRPSPVPTPLRPRAARKQPASSTRLEPISMRYKIVVSRVQTAERHVRAPSEAEALAKVQAELDKPYGFIGGWQTIDTDMTSSRS